MTDTEYVERMSWWSIPYGISWIVLGVLHFLGYF